MNATGMRMTVPAVTDDWFPHAVHTHNGDASRDRPTAAARRTHETLGQPEQNMVVNE
jgi:hypothetical protein